MAKTPGLPGTEKAALKNMISAFLRKTLHEFDFLPLPEKSDELSAADWNAASLAHLAGIEAGGGAIVAKDEAIHEVSEPDPEQAAAVIVRGPWLKAVKGSACRARRQGELRLALPERAMPAPGELDPEAAGQRARRSGQETPGRLIRRRRLPRLEDWRRSGRRDPSGSPA